MYEQVAASRNRMAQQLSAANRHVSFLKTALESRRGEVAAAMASMQALTQVSTALICAVETRTDSQRSLWAGLSGRSACFRGGASGIVVC